MVDIADVALSAPDHAEAERRSGRTRHLHSLSVPTAALMLLSAFALT